MTAIAEAFAKSGLTPADVALDIAIAKYLNSGGTIAGAIARVNVAAERMSGMGQPKAAGNGQTHFAQTRQPVEDNAAILGLPRGLTSNAPLSSSNRGGEGHPEPAEQGHSNRALPDREPKPQRAAIDFGAAAHAIKTKLALTVLDRVKTSDGRAWGDVGAHELDGMSRDGALAQAIKNHIGVLSNSQRFKTIRQLVNAKTFEAIRSKTHGA